MIKRNRAKCLGCGKTVESKHRHDFVYCKCGKIAVDGGLSYLKRSGDPTYIEELSEHEECAHSGRNHLCGYCGVRCCDNCFNFKTSECASCYVQSRRNKAEVDRARNTAV